MVQTDISQSLNRQNRRVGIDVVAQTRTRSIIDGVIPANGQLPRLARDMALIVLFALITAGAARISVHLPFTPVPITGQTLAVLLAGATIGSRRGAADPLRQRPAGRVRVARGGPSVREPLVAIDIDSDREWGSHVARLLGNPWGR